MPATVPCPVCGAGSRADHEVRIRGRTVPMHRCPDCGLYFLANPTWLDEAYADPISDVDVGLPSRCVALARTVEALVRSEGRQDRELLDFGGGYGLLTRLVRDSGLRMLHHDPYAKNLFAQGFEAGLDRSYGGVTMIEVLEHLTDPVAVLDQVVASTDLVVVSTVLVPPSMTDLSAWWYLLPDLGQHITFHTESSLAALARRLGLRLTTDHAGLHVLHRAPLRPLSRVVVRRARLSAAVGSALRTRDGSHSLRDEDAVHALRALKGRGGAAPGA